MILIENEEYSDIEIIEDNVGDMKLSSITILGDEDETTE